MQGFNLNTNSTFSTVLFADIVGYTAMMQEDEQSAFVVLRKFQRVLNKNMDIYNGSIANFYGDGALCIFQKPLDAILASMEIQSSFGQDVLVPVRIGIHYGKVTIDQDNVFGHTVNLASRIESMGVPGAILFSKIIKEQISLDASLQMISLGSFEYKNVDDSIEVFAIANKGFPLPKRIDLKGKFKESQDDIPINDKSIAVLPFINRTGQPEDEYFIDAISEEVMYALSKIKQIKVAGRVSSFSFKGTKLDGAEIGNRLQVHNLLEGSVQKSGNSVRVTAQLIDVLNGVPIWTDRFDRKIEDIFAVQEEIAQVIIQKLELTLFKEKENQTLTKRQTDNLEAYQLYLRGKYYLEQRTSLDISMSCYQKAIELDQKYALAHSGMSYVYFYQVLFDFKPPSYFIKAQESADKALKLDETLAEAYIINGIVYFYYYWNPSKALEQYKKALELDPNYDIIRIMAYYHCMIGHPDESEKLARKAVEMDALNLGAVLGLGEILYRSSKFAQAAEILEGLLSNFPGNKIAKAILGACYYNGGFTDKLHHFYKNLEIDTSIILFYNIAHIFYLIESGQKSFVDNLLNDVIGNKDQKWFSPACVSLIYFKMGYLEKAKEYLHLAFTERDPIICIFENEPNWVDFKVHPEIKVIIDQRFVRR